MGRRIALSFVVAAGILAAGCAAQKSSLTSGDYQERAGRIRNVGVVVAEARIMNLGAGGGATLNPEASDRCGTCTGSTVAQLLGERGYKAVVVPLDDDTRAVLAEYMKLRGDIFTPYPSNQGKIEGLAPLASVSRVCGKSEVDALVLVGALDHVSTGGRKAFLGALALFGVIGGGGMAYADLSAVDSSGKIIFYDRRAGSGYALTQDEGVQKAFGELVAGLPLAAGR